MEQGEIVMEMEKYKQDTKTLDGKPLIFEHKGIKAIILQNIGLGFLCGYVSIPKSFKEFGKHYNDLDYSVHGGLTFSESSLPNGTQTGWVIGFDCGHYNDFAPLIDYRSDYATGI